MLRTTLGVLAGLLVKDIIRWEAQKLLWRMEVNRLVKRPTPWKNQIVRMLSGNRAKYGEQ